MLGNINFSFSVNNFNFSLSYPKPSFKLFFTPEMITFNSKLRPFRTSFPLATCLFAYITWTVALMIATTSSKIFSYSIEENSSIVNFLSRSELIFKDSKALVALTFVARKKMKCFCCVCWTYYLNLFLWNVMQVDYYYL